MKKLVTLWKRPSYDGKRFIYYLIYIDEHGKRRQKSLGHADTRKAERHRAQFERELRMGVVEPKSMRLSEFIKDSLDRTRTQVRSSTLCQARIAMEHFIRVIGNIDIQLVKHAHGERFAQACLDSGNAPATAGKKLRHLKRVFQLGVDRGQLDENPLRRIKPPRTPKKKIRVLTKNECSRLLRAARDNLARQLAMKNRLYQPIQWELLIRTVLCTGLRRGELLNTTWKDIDFETKTIDVAPKTDTPETWEWHIKDTDRRTLGLTDDLVDSFAQLETQQPEGYPYVFIQVGRYDHIQARRGRGNWTVQDGVNPTNNFERGFTGILARACIENVTFHDLRRTCITNWFANGLAEYEVMRLAGHACFSTTHAFYLAVREDLIDRGRAASTKVMAAISVANLLQHPLNVAT